MAVRIETHAEPIPGYTLLTRLGSGGFGDVWKAEAPGGIFKAIKIIHGDLRSQDADLVRYAEQELKSLKRVQQVRHPYLLTLDRYDIVDGRLMIVMELADCNLWDRFRACRDRGLPGIPRDELLLYMLETAEVLDLFNDQFQLQHLDIKPQNLFLLHNHVKVADFGQVKDLQGLTAQVTGGITPVYAAPETFDGIITRYCDQYSLACVYQELLTGVRPFDGSSINQLFTQHMNLPPNLEASPAGDRPALARALAKKPEDRWPTVTEFVRALYGLPRVSARVSAPAPRSGHDSTVRPGPGSGTFQARGPERGAAPPLPPLVVPGSAVAGVATDTPPPLPMAETISPAASFLPPEAAGPGCLRPALVIGLGQAGLRVLQRFRFDLTERYGPPEVTPLVRTLYVDTDPDALEDALRPRPQVRRAALRPSDVFPAKLNRAAHYLKPRLNGQTLTEGWFDPQLLYKIPRAPVTMGIRLFGRLAFCDHYRALTAKVQAELDATVAGDALDLTEARTGLQRRTSRPRVYVVAGLAGGTGGGMFLDVAYCVRERLQRMGIQNPEVIGVLVAPPSDPSVVSVQALGNTYAALTELNHYARPDTVFVADYDDHGAAVREKAPPFSHCYLIPSRESIFYPPPAAPAPPPPAASGSIPLPAARLRTVGSGTFKVPGSRSDQPVAGQRGPDPAALRAAFKPYADAAELIRLNLFTPLGRVVDERRARPTDGEAAPRCVTLTAFGLSSFAWPRAEVIARATARVGRAVLKRWAAPDLKRAREVIPGLAQKKWSQLGLEPEVVVARLREAAGRAAGAKIDEQIALVTDPLVPRGWRARLPEPAQVTVALDRLLKLLGPPASPGKRPSTLVEQAMAAESAAAATKFARDIRALVPALVDDPLFRLSGAEELVRQFLATTDRLMEKFAIAAADLDKRAQAGFECVSLYSHHQKGMQKPPAAEFGQAVKLYPQARYEAATYRALVALYQAVREPLVGHLSEVATARQRLDEAAGAPEPPVGPEPPPDNHRLLPPGCANVDATVARFLGTVTDTDLTEIDRRLKAALDPELRGVFQACLNSSAGPEGVVAMVYEETRAHLDARLGAADLAGMFAERFRSSQLAERALEESYHEAEPSLVVGGPWAAGEVAVVGCPAGPGGEPLRELARRALPVAGLPLAETPDELTVYREWPTVPLAALPHLGPEAAAAYRNLPDGQQCPAHARLDITVWLNPAEG